AFLAGWYQDRKAAKQGISYRAIAAKVGYSSPGFFTQILQGKTNISLETAQGFDDLIGLKSRQREYFLALVVMNQSKDPKALELARQKLRKFLDFKIRDLKTEQERFLEAWHHAAIRELLGITPFQGDYQDLADRLDPRIPAGSAKESIELLLSLGLAARTSRGIERRDASISSGKSLTESVTKKFFRELHGLGARALDHFPKSQRNLSWVTFSVSPKAREEIVEELRNFRRRVLEIAARDDHPTEVHQLTLMLHPLSSRSSEAARR
ncbi:MAG: TIGR02147 family protein, partial [Fibrobacterota bacterium]